MSSTPATDHHRPKHPANRLAGSSSPYLRQHAHNPVDWWPWGPEAIAEACRRDVPIFLSVGYSTCYWCHVMERESFENEATAKLMGERFVSVKVDREERPEIDEIYMAAVQMLTGSGGWPMSVFLDPHSLRPFWGGTYFPPVPAHGRPSFPQVLTRMSEVFASQRAEVLAQAEQVGQAVAERLSSSAPPVPVGSAQVKRATETLLTIVDRTNGGFGGAPKFPQPVYLEYALDAIEHARGKSAAALAEDGNIKAIHQAVRQTLIAMAIGGIHDHVGGGFHRYSVDATWTVPHFEKMLYDNGQLLSVYARAAAAEDHPATAALFRGVCERLVGYVDRELTAGSGLLFAAQDAEVDGREGKNYVWTADEVRAALAASPEHLDFVMRAFGVDKGPNFQDPHHPGEAATSVLRLAAAPNGLARELGLTPERFDELYQQSTQMLLAVRSTRKQPRLDDKVITSWNAIMIEGLATAGRMLGKLEWVTRARGLMDVLCARRVNQDGLFRRLDDSAPRELLLEDQAYLLRALLACSVAVGSPGTHEARSQAATLLKRAHRLAQAVDEHFGSPSGGFHDTLLDRPDLFVRASQTYDGAVPSAASVMLCGLVQLAMLTGEAADLVRALRCLAALSPAIAESPVGSINSTRALAELLRYHPAEVVGHFAGLANAGGAADRSGPARDGRDVVGISISAEEIVLRGSDPSEFFLRLEIAPGYHINSAFAAEQSGGTVVALRADIIGGEGVRIYGEYPEGETVAELPFTVHTGQLDLRLVVEADPGIDTTVERTIVLQFQACRDDACLAPSRLALPVRLVFAAEGGAAEQAGT